MHSPLQPVGRCAGIALLLTLGPTLGGCATIVGTVVSPITGGVDLCREELAPAQWYWTPLTFLGGAIAGPFVAFYNGVNHDAGVFDNFTGYWRGFDDVFRPFEMIKSR